MTCLNHTYNHTIVFFFLLALLSSQFSFASAQRYYTKAAAPLSEADSIVNPIMNPITDAVNNETTSIATHSGLKIADYTVLIYMIGSDLESRYYSATKDLTEMKNAGNNQKINIIIQTGGGGGNKDIASGGKRFVDFSTVQRHLIVNGTFHTLMDLGVRNMAERSTLSDFIKWGVLTYPAKKYAIILWDHGAGLNGFGKDLIFKKKDVLTPFDLEIAFLAAQKETGVKFDLIGFDACLMSSLEVAARLQHSAQYMVSSEEIEPEWGWDYTAIIKDLMSNPSQSGRSLGMAIVDSYKIHSATISQSERFGAQRDITLSVIDLTKIPQLIKEVNILSRNLASKIQDLPSAINLSKSIDLTEHYGRSTQGSFGLVDLFDLVSNIQRTYSGLSSTIKAVQDSLKAAISYRFNGEARPNANGLSIYMPLLKNEIRNTTNILVVDPDWWKLVATQDAIIGNDKVPPLIKSIREGNIVKANVYGSDISRIFSQIITNSSNGHKLMYTQNIEPSLIDKQGSLLYTEPKMLVICNETKCIPATMNLEINRDKKFVFIPVRLESNKDNINENMSLVYEIGKDYKFVFLGATPEINPEETVPKGKFSLYKDYTIFTKALPVKVEPQSNDEINSRKLRDISRDVEDGPLLVNDPARIVPQYIDIVSPFYVSFTICDYSDNCDKTRWYRINPNEQNLPKILPNIESGYDLLNEKTNKTAAKSMGDLYTYINPRFGFQLKYPSDWIRQSENTTESSNDKETLVDPEIVQLMPSNYHGIAGSNYRPSIHVTVTDWPYKESPKYLFDAFNNTNNRAVKENYKILSASPAVVAGKPAFKFIIEYLSKSEQYLGVAGEKRIEVLLTVLMNGRMYTMDFGAYSSQFNNYLPVVENIINSFGPYPNPNPNPNPNQTHIGLTLDYKMSHNSMSNVTTGSLKMNNTNGAEKILAGQKLSGDIVFSTYTDKKYKYSIKYPFNIGTGEPLPVEKLNPKLTGILFMLDNSSMRTADPGEMVNVILEAFYKNETETMKRVSGALLSDLKDFNINGVISAAREHITFYNRAFPNFSLLNNGTTTLRNTPAYAIEYEYFNPFYRSMQHEKLLYLLTDQRLFVLEFSSKPSKYNEYLPIFQKMIDSFEIKNLSVAQKWRI